MHEKMKELLGIEVANCSTCVNLGSDGDGYEYNGTWPVCDKIDRFNNLKSFPFKKEMECWEPEFWSSKFTDMIKGGSDEELDAACTAFRNAYDEAILASPVNKEVQP